MGLRDFLKQEAQRVQQDAQHALAQAEAVESIPVESHPLCEVGKDVIDLYVKCVLILRAEMPLAYPTPEEGEKQLRLFARSLGLSPEHQHALEEEAASYGDQAKTETLLLFSSQCNAGVMTCFMCDAARLHGVGYRFEGDFADLWRDAGSGIAKLSGELLTAVEKLCRDMAAGRKLAAPEKYAPVPAAFVSYFGQEAFAPANGEYAVNGQYLVIDLSGGPQSKRYPSFWTDDEPDISDDACRTTELWLRHIPAGTFTMGSPQNEVGRNGDERQTHMILPENFRLGKFVVTQGQWKAVMGNTPSCFEGETRPVESVSWEEARKFCDQLNKKCTDELPKGYRFDLPTEAQWEYACRAGTKSALNNGKNLKSVYDVGPYLNEVGWYDENSRGGTHRVGEKLPNAWGLYDMHGNVCEWCRDGQHGQHVIRGGCFFRSARDCRSARHLYFLDPGSSETGFRLALVPVRDGTRSSVSSGEAEKKPEE